MSFVAAAVGALKGVVAAASQSVVGAFLIRSAASLGFSLLAQALAPRPRSVQRGIQTEFTSAGGVAPQAFILGRYATAGHHVCPPYSHGGGTGTDFLNYVIEVSDIPGVSLAGLIVDGDYSEIGDVAHPDYGLPLLGQRVAGIDHAWVRFHDGTQSAADALMLARYGDHPERPWGSDMVGTGIAYLVLTFRINREVFSGLPGVRAVLDGIPLYDPRADSTAGGDGPQRADDPATWAPTDNRSVMVLNILRGIPLPCGAVWGAGAGDDEIDAASFLAAMNADDEDIGGRPAFTAGFEVKPAEMEPADVIDELLRAGLGRISEFGGRWRMRVGPPATPVFAIQTASRALEDGEEETVFPPLPQVHNAVSVTYVEPASLWEPREAPLALDAVAEAEDGRRQIAQVSLPAVSNAAQAAAVAHALLQDGRRFRTHVLSLPPEAAVLEPLDCVTWTDAALGYDAKLFEVEAIEDRPVTLIQQVVLREVDPDDFEPDPAGPPPAVPFVTGLTRPVQGAVETPVGTVGLFAAGITRAGWLPCDGTARNVADFPELAARLGPDRLNLDGTELLTNPDFATDLDDWLQLSPGFPLWTWNAGRAEATNFRAMYQDFTQSVPAVLLVDIEQITGVHRFNVVLVEAGQPLDQGETLASFRPADSGLQVLLMPAPSAGLQRLIVWTGQTGTTLLNSVSILEGGTFDLPDIPAPAGTRYLIRAD